MKPTSIPLGAILGLVAMGLVLTGIVGGVSRQPVPPIPLANDLILEPLEPGEPGICGWLRWTPDCGDWYTYPVTGYPITMPAGYP
jgi:hypothetical protein